MAQYGTFNCTTIGYSHIQKGIGCEDYSARLDDGDIHIAVVSDGHGDKACFRSHLGSEWVTKIAVENLHAFAKNIQQQGWESRLFQGKERERMVRQLIRSIVGGWNLKILQDLQDNPITEEEYALSGSWTDLYRSGQELPHIYGCTLIAALVTDRYLLVLHQGDGRCVIVHQDGTADQPVPWDDRCQGNVSTSMCHEDTITACRYYLADLKRDQIVACYACSDGIEDSLEDQDAVNAFFCNITSVYAQDGGEALEQNLLEFLPQMSQSGSADDMSIAGIVDLQSAKLHAERLELIYLLHASQAEYRRASGKVNSMQRKNDHLKDAMVDARAEYDRLVADRHSNKTRLEQLLQEVFAANKFQDDSEIWLEEAKKKLEDARIAYDEYNTRRNEFIAKAQAAQAQVQLLQDRLDALNISSVPTEPVAAEEEPLEFTEEVHWEEPVNACPAAAPEMQIPQIPAEPAPVEIPEEPAEEVTPEIPEDTAEEIPTEAPATPEQPTQENPTEQED